MVGDREKMRDAIIKAMYESSQHPPLFRLYLVQVLLQDASESAAAQAKRERIKKGTAEENRSAVADGREIKQVA